MAEEKRDGRVMELVILRGLPGSGKSSWARHNIPNSIICSADDYMVDEDGEYDFLLSRLEDAHRKCFEKAHDALFAGSNDVVIDNTNCSAWEFSPYISLAKMHGYSFRIVYIRASLEACFERQIHGVPRIVMERMEERLETTLPPVFAPFQAIISMSEFVKK